MDYKLQACVLVLVLCICQVQCRQEGTLSSQVLLNISKQMNNPLLRLIGISFSSLENKFTKVENLVKQADLETQVNETSNLQEHMERKLEGVESKILQMLMNKYDTLSHNLCELYTCSEWSPWTICNFASRDEFGVKNRSRVCGNQSQLCNGTSDIKNVTESSVCQNAYRPDYEITKNGFCIKVHISGKLSWHDAEMSCRRHSGHLIHIDSEQKSDDVTELLNRYNTDRVWVDGIQLSSGAPWQFYNGMVVSGFTNWQYDQPNESRFPNCMYLLPDKWEWADFPCSNSYSYVCEIKNRL